MTLVEGAVEDEAERMEALAALAEVSLLKHDPFEDGTPAVTVHRLVQAVARARRRHMVGAGGRRATDCTAEGNLPREGDSDPQSWPLCAQLTPHLVGCEKPPDDVSGFQLVGLHRAGSYLRGRGAYPRPRRFFAMHWR